MRVTRNRRDCAVANSLLQGQFGSKGDISAAVIHVRFGSKADVPARLSNVRFTPKSGHRETPINGDPPAMTDADLIRILDAQDQIYDQVVEELVKGRKETHWMWFIFPQLAGLGRSAMAQHYALKDLDQAKRYLADSILGARLRQAVKLMTSHHEKSAYEILGSPDDLKFRSCLTLFREAASGPSDRALFSQALDRFYQSQPDAATLALLR